MDVIILAGGYAKRLWPLTRNKPKPLLKIMGKEILSYILDDLHNFGDAVDQIYVSTNKEFKPHFIDFFKGHSGYSNMAIDLVIEPHTSSNRFGPIGGLKYILDEREADEREAADEYMVIAGDNMFRVGLLNFLNAYRMWNKSAIALQSPALLTGMSALGIAEIGDTSIVTQFDEKPAWPRNKFISTGCYILKKNDFGLVSDYINAGMDIDSLGQFIRWLAIDQRCGIKGYVFGEEWFDVGTLDTLLLANRSYLESANLGELTGNSEINANVYIGKGTIIKDSIIGPYTYVGENCVITDSNISDAIIYDNVNIVDGTIQHSVIDEDSNVVGKISGIVAR